jgi:hypothetical protein
MKNKIINVLYNGILFVILLPISIFLNMLGMDVFSDD